MGSTTLYGLNGDGRPDRVWFSAFFVLNGVSISSLSVLNRVSLHLNGKSVHLKFVKIVQKTEFVPFLLALMPEDSPKTRLGKDFWLNVFRRGLKNLDDVLNRVENQRSLS